MDDSPDSHARPSRPTSSAPAENWDEDFDFQLDSPRQRRAAPVPVPSSPTRAPFPRPGPSSSARDSAGPSTPLKSHLTRAPLENWDDDFLDRTESPSDHRRSGASTGDGASGFPSPPRSANARRRVRSTAPAQVTPPVRAPRRTGSTYNPGFGSPSRNGTIDTENWDVEFGLAPRRLASAAHTVPSSAAEADSGAWSSDEEHADAHDLGLLTPSKADEEDRTVTARARRVPVPIKIETPPPVPPLPAGVTSAGLSSTASGSPSGSGGAHPHRAPSRASLSSAGHGATSGRLTPGLSSGHGAPRSPSASIFSLPSTLGGHGTVSSAAGLGLGLGLRTTLSSSSHNPLLAGGPALAFPPTPPQPRERRKLRKRDRRDHEDALELRELDGGSGPSVLRKRRPHPRAEDVFDSTGSAEMRSRRMSIDEEPEPDDDLELEMEFGDSPDRVAERHSIDVHALPPGSSSVGHPHTPDRSALHTPDPVRPPTPPATTTPAVAPTRTPLLARLGSVTRWGVRKKRASTVPDEATRGLDATPRPPSSLAGNGSGAGSAASSPPAARSWLARATSAGPELLFGSPPRAGDALRRESSLDRLRSLVATSPSRRGKGKSMPPLRLAAPGIMREASGGSTDGGDSLRELRLPAQPARGLRKRASAAPPVAPGVGKAQKQRSGSYAGAAHALGSRSSMSLPEPPQPARGLASPSEDDLPRPTAGGRRASQSREAADGKRKERDMGRGGEEESRLMSRVRRISFGGKGKHRASKSVAGTGADDAAERARSMSPGSPRTPPRSADLLPPIELQPPSPPRAGALAARSDQSLRQSLDALRDAADSTTPASALRPRPTSPQTASLGRASATPTRTHPEGASPAHRRSSLGDLKIPMRISQAQVGLRQHLGMVREFATSIDRLKELQVAYYGMVGEIQQILNSPPSPLPPPNPPQRRGRARSNTNPTPALLPPTHVQLASAFHAIGAKYRIAWECAELLIELGGGTPPDPPGLVASASAPLVPSESALPEPRRSRERALTLENRPGSTTPDDTHDGGAAAAAAAWRASTGRNDLSRRQLLLLRDMLQGPDALTPPTASTEGPDEPEPPVNRTWRWGDAATSTLTLPSEEGGAQTGASAALSPMRKRLGDRLGMRGLRDMLRGLKSRQADHRDMPVMPLMSPPAAEMLPPKAGTTRSRPRSKTSSAAPSMRSAVVPALPSPGIAPMPSASTGTVASFAHKPSPRRPSLASIFRIGQRQRSGNGSPGATQSSGSAEVAAPAMNTRVPSGGSRMSGTSSEEDWDRMDSASDVDGAAAAAALGAGTGTVRLAAGSTGSVNHSPYAPARTSSERSPGASRPRPPAASRSSLFTADSAHARTLSNVAETPGAAVAAAGAPVRRASVRSSRAAGSLRATPGGGVFSVRPHAQPTPPRAGTPLLADPQLAMTPENIRPLLENAREVQARLTDCVGEVRALLVARST